MDMADQRIDPTHYDAVVTTSGLPEVLIASALARAGKVVLQLDPSGTYGSSWASLSASDFVQQLLNRIAKQRLEQHQKQPAAPGQCVESTGQDSGMLRHAEAASVSQQLRGAHDCSVYTHPGLDHAWPDKGLIIDLAPRVLYQDELMVKLLVSCKAHHYLEFKLVDGNYVYLTGGLQRVPASRADLFADRTLSLSDKRSLGRFMAACVEAAEGSGRLQGAFDEQPLVDLLEAEGLSQHLQHIVMYGIAMAETPQHSSKLQVADNCIDHHHHHQQQQQQHLPSEPPHTSLLVLEASGQHQHAGSLLSAADGLAAFLLYSQSLGKYGGSGALMAPCYGSGSLAEAFVRLAAVKGAVTALRHSIQYIQEPGTGDLPGAGGQTAAAAAAAACSEGGTAADVDGAGRSNVGEHGVSVCENDGQQGRVGAVDDAVRDIQGGEGEQQQQQQQGQQGQQQQQQGQEEDMEEEEAGTCPVAPSLKATAAAHLRLTLSTGQDITTGCAITSRCLPTSCTSTSSSQHSTGAASPPRVCSVRVVALLDGSLVEGDSSLVFVIPPGALGPGQDLVIRGLQMGPAQSVTQPGQHLLYLSALIPLGEDQQQQQQKQQQEMCKRHKAAEDASASAEGRTAVDASGKVCSGDSGSDSGCGKSSTLGMMTKAEQVLGPALEALACTQHLQQLAAAASGSSPRVHQQQGDCHERDSEQQQQQQEEGPAAAEVEARLKGEIQEETAAGRAGCAQVDQPTRPQVLAACFYSMCQAGTEDVTAGGCVLQGQQQQHGVKAADVSGVRHVLQCPQAPLAGFVSYTDCIKEAEALYKSQFPDLPWLTDPLPSPTPTAAAAEPSADTASAAAPKAQGHAAAEGGSRAGNSGDAQDGAAADDDDEADAIDELTAALMELSAGLEGMPGQQGHGSSHV